MRRNVLAIVVVVVVAILVGAGYAYLRNRAASAVPEGAVALRQGATYDVSLDANPSTGYAWTVSYDQSLLELANRVFQPQSSLLGAGGKEVFTFRALAARGVTTVSFEYKRSWETQVANTATVTFVLQPSK